MMTKKILNVPYVSRYGENGERLDCGACCVAMLLGSMAQVATAQEIVTASEVSGDRQISPTALIRGAEAFGLTMFQAKDWRLEKLLGLIDHGQPPIVMLKYSYITERFAKRSTGRHYVVVVGYDDAEGLIYVNDPHYPEAGEAGSGGYQRAYAYTEFVAAWEATDCKVILPVPPAAPEAPADAAFSFSQPATVGDVWVMATPWLNMRAQPDVSAQPLGGLPFGQHLAALSAESGPDAYGYTWQQVLTDQGATGWVATGDGKERYVSDKSPLASYTVYVLDTQPVRYAGGLALRETRDIDAITKERVPIGGKLVVSQSVTEADGTPWLWSQSSTGENGWARATAGGVELISTVPPSNVLSEEPAPVEAPVAQSDWYGINIDPDLDNAHRALTLDELHKGVGWVRFVFKQSDMKLREHTRLSEAQSLALYDQKVDYYRAAGTKSLMILNWESFRGHIPWQNNHDWPRYARDFGNYVRQVAQHFRGRVTAYQIWNEGDNPQGHGTSIYIPPTTYALILRAAGQAIKEVDPAAKVVFGGVCLGPEANVKYVQQTRDAMQGYWPVDAVGMHPYGRYPASISKTVPGLNPTGSLEQYLDIVTHGLHDPIWITEIGVPFDDPAHANNSDFFPHIARYLQEVYAKAQPYRAQVPVIIWFAWANKMRGSGILDSHGNNKGPIYDAFFKAVRGLV